MQLIFNSIRSIVFGLIVLILNIPVFWSFSEAIIFVRELARSIGIEV